MGAASLAGRLQALRLQPGCWRWGCGAGACARRACSRTTRRAARSSTCASASSCAARGGRMRQAEDAKRAAETPTRCGAACSTCRTRSRRCAPRSRGCTGQNEQLLRDLADLQRRQKDLAQGVDERLRKFEPAKVTVDGQEFIAEPDRIARLRRGAGDLPARRFRRRRRPPSLDFHQALSAKRLSARRPCSGWATRSTRTRDYKDAITNFRALLAAAPDHPRAPEARAVDRQLPDRAEGQRAARARRSTSWSRPIRSPRRRSGGQGAAGPPALNVTPMAPTLRRARRRRTCERRFGGAGAPVRRAGAQRSAPAMWPWSASAASAPGRPRRWRAAASAR